MVVNRISKMAKAESPTLNLDKPECQLINGTVSERSLWAEKMSATHNSIRCSEHNMFHNWKPMPSDDIRSAAGRSYGVRFDAYVEVTPGKWFFRDIKPKIRNKKLADD